MWRPRRGAAGAVQLATLSYGYSRFVRTISWMSDRTIPWGLGAPGAPQHTAHQACGSGRQAWQR